MSLLKTQNHECLSLQQDFNTYGSPFFEFRILHFENDLKKRLQLEKQLISQQLPNECDNSSFFGFDKNKPLVGQQILMDEKFYSSIREAEKKTGISKTTIIRRLNNTNDLACIRLNKVTIPKKGKYDFVINGLRYSSTQEVIANNLAISDNQVRERCSSKSLKWKHWQMVQKNRSNDYPDRE